MNNTGDPIPTSSASPAQVAVCPRCSTQLRLARAISDQTPIKCYSCQAVFCLAPIDTAPVATTEAPTRLSPAPAPAQAPRKAEFSSPPFPLSNNPAEQHVPGVMPAPTAANAMPRMTSPPMASPGAPRVIAPTQPAPPTLAAPAPVPSPATTTAPPPPKMRKVLQLGPQETMVASVILVALVAGGIAAFSMFSHGSPNSSESTDSATDTPAVASKQDSVGASLEKPAISPKRLRTIPNPQSRPPDVVAKTAALVGFWEARSDDGSMSTLELREDESAVLLPATEDPSMTPKLEGKWALMGQEGNTATVHIIYTATGLEVHQMTIDLYLPDALTVVRSAFRGRVERTDQRYVRRAKTQP